MKKAEMNEELKKWLDDNIDIEIAPNMASWHWDGDQKVVYWGDCDVPYISLVARPSGEPIYTDVMSYCMHGLGGGEPMSKERKAETEDAIYARMPPALAETLRREYEVEGSLEEDLAEYLRDRNGWTPNGDYFDRPDDGSLDEEAIAALHIPHDEEADAGEGEEQ